MPISCEQNDLLAAAACFAERIPPGQQAALQTYLLAVIAGGSLDPNVLLEEARCFRCADGMLMEIQTYLLCQIANK